MKAYDPELPLFSLHIPKSGGTSFKQILTNWFSKKQFIDIEKKPRVQIYFRKLLELGLPQIMFQDRLLLHYRNHLKPSIPNIVYDLHFIQKLTSKPICVHGHFHRQIDEHSLFDFYPEAKQFIAFIRNPLDIHLSMYHYQKQMIEKSELLFKGEKIQQPETTIDRWLTNIPCYMLHFFPFEFNEINYKNIIEDNFVHIGISEDFQKSIDIMASKLGLSSYDTPVLNASKWTEQPSNEAIDQFISKHSLEYKIYNYCKALNQ